ncbi:MAG: hypothetical protein OXU61_06345 [Gammaproteobacteria bacterium]|nr:hypothetical protein [Gammaproteobacteria bacterium]
MARWGHGNGGVGFIRWMPIEFLHRLIRRNEGRGRAAPATRPSRPPAPGQSHFFAGSGLISYVSDFIENFVGSSRRRDIAQVGTGPRRRPRLGYCKVPLPPLWRPGKI